MKRIKLPSWANYLFIFCFLILIGCSTPSILRIPEPLPPVIKEYKHITLYGFRPGMVNTEIYLDKDDLYSIFATGRIFFGRILPIAMVGSG